MPEFASLHQQQNLAAASPLTPAGLPVMQGTFTVNRAPELVMSFHHRPSILVLPALAALMLAACGDSDTETPADITCAEPADCPADFVCDPAASDRPDGCVALPGCTTDDGCALGEVCGEGSACVPTVVPPVPTGTTTPLFAVPGEAGAGFYDSPWPSDARLDDDGTLALAGIPNPFPDDPGGSLFAGLIETAEQTRGASQVPVMWFRFDGPLTPTPADRPRHR